MPRALILLLLVLNCACSLQAQRRRHVFLELGGSGGLGSLNYEQDFLSKENLSLTWRLGLSLAPIDPNNGSGIVVPAMIHCLYGGGAHHLEGGIGEGFTVTTKGSFFFRSVLSLGYRYQHPEKHFTFRAAYTPIISDIFTFQWQHWAGISVGYVFLNK